MPEGPASPSAAPRAHSGRWRVHQVDRTAGFATRVTWKSADGTMALWESRDARRRGRVQLLDASGRRTGFAEAAPATARRLARANVVASTSFALGGALFALGAVLGRLDLGTGRDEETVYLVGGVFFALGGYVSLLQASNAPTDLDEHGSLSSRRWRWFNAQPRQIGWLSTAVLFAGSLVFGISLVAAYAADLTPRETDSWVWGPDIIGCVCFLVSGHLALVEVGHGWIWRIVNDLSWWIVGVNQLGSIVFFLAGVASFTLATTSAALDPGLARGGTFAGGLCFLVAGVLQLFERPARGSSSESAGPTDDRA